MIRHRGTCEADGCGWVRRENCEDCLMDVVRSHTARTGHPVHVTVTTDEQASANILTMASRARRVLLTGRLD